VAHTFVNKSQNNDQTGTTVTIYHTPGSAATVVCLSICALAARTGGAPTIDGDTATQADQWRIGNEMGAEVWYVCKDFDGSEITISIPNSGNEELHCEVVSAYAGSGYDSEWVDDDGNSQSAGNGFDLLVTPDATGDFVYSRLGCGEGKDSDVSSSYGTETYSNDHGQQSSKGVYKVTTEATQQTIDWVWSNDDGGGVAVCFKSVAGVSGVTFSVGCPAGTGAALTTTQLFDYIFSVGIPTGVGAPLGVTAAGGTVFPVGCPAGIGAPLATTPTGAALVAVGIPSGLGEVIASSQLFDYVFSVGAPTGAGVANPVGVVGNALFAVGIPAGAGVANPVSVDLGITVAVGLPTGIGVANPVTGIGNALVAAGLPSGIAEAIAVTVLTGGSVQFSVGLPTGIGVANPVAATGGMVYAVGAPVGVGAANPVSIVTGALIAAGLPTGVAEAISVSALGGAIVVVGSPAGTGEALSSSQLFDYVFSVGIPSGAGQALPVTVYTDGAPTFTFYIFQSTPLEE
jgi:hypothetical protein